MFNDFWLNPFLWTSMYLTGYTITTLLVGLIGIERIAEKMPRYLLRMFIILIFVLPPIVMPFTKGPDLPIPPIVTLLSGALLLGTALAIKVTAQKRIGVSPALKIKERLTTTGIYGLVRHPLYTANGLFAMGMALLFNSLYAFLFSILYALLFLPIIHFEERDLVKKYGEEYEQYKEKVGLLFPKKEQPR